jgi:branched-subunit amino acid transport protein AzlD
MQIACQTYWVGGGLVGVALGVFTITLALRAAPFAVLAILATTALHGAIAAEPRTTCYAVLAVAVTAGTHLAFGRRTILSVGIGTAVYVILVNAV